MQRLYKSLYFLGISLLIFAFARAALLVAYPGQFDSLEVSSIITAFFHGVRFDLSIMLKLIGIPLLLMNLPFRFANHRLWFDSFAWIIYVMLFGMALLLLIDLLYYQHVARHMGNELLLLKDDMDFGISVAFGPYKWFVIALLMSAAGLGWLWFKILQIANEPKKELEYVPDNKPVNNTKFRLG